MKTFLIVQTAINLIAAVAGKNGTGRLMCLLFGIWGGAELLLTFYH